MPNDLRPHQFLGQRKNAEMSFHTYPRGAKSYMQKCHSRSAPRQVFWARRDTQKCHSACAQRGVKLITQKCHLECTPHQFNGAIEDRRNVIRATPRGGRAETAEMPYKPRPHRIWVIHDAQKCHSSDYPITRGQHLYAEMPTPIRLATKKEVKYG